MIHTRLSIQNLDCIGNQPSKWIKWEKQLNDVGAKVVYFTYTQHISSILISKQIKNK